MLAGLAVLGVPSVLPPRVVHRPGQLNPTKMTARRPVDSPTQITVLLVLVARRNPLRSGADASTGRAGDDAPQQLLRSIGRVPHGTAQTVAAQRHL